MKPINCELSNSDKRIICFIRQIRNEFIKCSKVPKKYFNYGR